MKQLTIQDVENNKSYTFYDTRAEGSMIASVEGMEYPSVIEAIEDVPNDGGAVFLNSKFGRRRVGLRAYITCDRLEERLELLAALRQTGSLKKLTFTTLDNIQLQFYAMVKNLVFPYTKMETQLLLELIAPDYRFYSQTETVYESAQTTVTGGASIPATIPMSISAGSDAANVITNDGNEQSFPIITVYGPGTTFHVHNHTTGEGFTLNTTLSSGQYVEIDTINRTVKLNGVTNVYSIFEGDFWSLAPGDNALHFEVTSGSTGATIVRFTYRSAYNGI